MAVKKQVFISALVVLLGLGVVAYYLFFQGFLARQQFERQNTRTLSDLRLANLRINALFSTEFSYRDYDRSVADIKAFETLLAELSKQIKALDPEAKEGLLPLVKTLEDGFVQKSRIVERYKAVNAVQSNSLRYLHELYQQIPAFSEQDKPKTAQIHLEMSRFLAGLAAASFHGAGQESWERLQSLAKALPAKHPAAETMTLFLLHAQKFIDGADALKRLSGQSKSLGMEAQISKLSEATDRLFRSRQAFWMLLGNIAFIAGTLFFVAFVWVFIREERLKKRLKIMNRDLESRVVEEVQKRQHQEQMLIQQSKLAAMGEMIGAIAHQWRQPLNTLAINIQDLEDAHNFGELDETYIKEMIARSMGMIKHMSQTINDFRSFFRQSKEKSRFDAYTAVRQTLELVQDQYRNHQIAVLMTCDPQRAADRPRLAGGIFEDESCRPGAYMAEGYLNEFKQAVLNIFTNAKDAISERREREDNPQMPGVIIVSFVHEDQWIVIDIEDNGGGIEEALLERIFEPYFSTKEEGKGTGIGLYMAKTILEANMGGRLSVQNAKEGARFTLWLAAASAE